MKKTLLVFMFLLIPAICFPGTANTVRNDAESSDQIPVYRPSLGGSLGSSNPNAYFRLSLGDIIEDLVGEIGGSINTWLSGSGAPSDATGNDGDYYLDTVASAYYGPKASGSWTGTGPISMVGPIGPSGSNGSPGADGADGSDGVGVPSGGGEGQVLSKKTSTDFDTEWVDLVSGEIDLSSPGTIGGATPGIGYFTTLSASEYTSSAADGERGIILSENTSKTPGTGLEEIYNEAGQLKYSENGVEKDFLEIDDSESALTTTYSSSKIQELISGVSGAAGYVTPPTYSDDPGTDGQYSWDESFFYAHKNGSWDKFAVTWAGMSPAPTIPTLTSLTIPTSGDTATAVFSEAMTIGVGGSGGWTLNDPTNVMTYASGDGTDTIVFNLASTILSTDTPTVSYTQPTNGFESSDDGVDLASISGAAVANNSTQTGGVVTYFLGFNNGNTTTMNTTAPTLGESGTIETMFIKPITIPAGATLTNIWVYYKTPDSGVPYEVGVYTYETLGGTGTRVAGASVAPVANTWVESAALSGTTYFANETTVYIETGWDGTAATSPGLGSNTSASNEYYKAYRYGFATIDTLSTIARSFAVILEYTL